MSNPNVPQPNPQEAYRGVDHEQAVKEFGRAITQAALGNEAGGYSPDTPIVHEKHTGKVDETMIGDYDNSLVTARASNSTRFNEAWRGLELSGKTGDTRSQREVYVDLQSGKAQERSYKNGVKERGVPSTRRLMAATRLVNHKFGLNKDESKAA